VQGGLWLAKAETSFFLDFLCQLCAPGFVKPVTGDTPCVACGIGEYAVNSTVCLPCPQHADARPGSAQCTCRPPYVLHQHVRVLCAANHFFSDEGLRRR
jgi:hypothetical protein